MQDNIHYGKIHFSRYVAQALEGHEVVIAKSGRPLVRLVLLGPPSQGRFGDFLRDTAVINADLKVDYDAEIDAMFE